MAKLKAKSSKLDVSAEIVGFYRGMLDVPAVLPAENFPPVALGKSWEIGEDGKFVLPELTLGWDVLAWVGQFLQHSRGEPWVFTPEQARIVLWWYALNPDGSFLYSREGIIQRVKGWGKDPFSACLLANELVGVCKFGGFEDGKPVAVESENAWLQVAAVTQHQTQNTMSLFPILFTDEAISKYRIVLKKKSIDALGGRRKLEAVTSNPRSMEGNRTTLVLLNETHHWLANNNGIEMYEALSRNSAKGEHVGARILHITNAYSPGLDSVAERTRIAYEESFQTLDDGRKKSLLQGVMYDSLEAPPDAPLSAEAAPDVVRGVRGDSIWLGINRIVEAILDPRIPPSESRRFWYNQIVANEESLIAPQDWDNLARPELKFKPGDKIVMFFDGSKSDDATALVGCRISDGYVQALGLWQAPPKIRRGTWIVPREKVDTKIHECMNLYRVKGFWADPSHAKEDGSFERFWANLVDEWHQQYSKKLILWAKKGTNPHSVEFDMSNTSSSGMGKIFVPAVERFVEDVENEEFYHDGSPELARHIKNARRFPTRFGISLSKDGRESSRKIDLAVCAVGARMMRRKLINDNKHRGGSLW